MKDIQLPNEVSGEKLVQILERASSESGFEFKKVEANDNSTPYYLSVYQKTLTPLNAFSDSPDFRIRFVGITNEGQYSTVRYCPEVQGIFTSEPKEIDIDKERYYKPYHDNLIKRVIMLAGQ